VNTSERDYDEQDAVLSAVAVTLHREWNSPRLWPSIEAAIRAHEVNTGLHARISIVDQSVNRPSSIVNC
jgi:hypothetical protein